MEKWIWAFLILLLSCQKTVIKPEPAGRYFIDNQTTQTLIVEARNFSQEVNLSQRVIPPESIVNILSVVDRKNGNVNPSNFFTEFRVFYDFESTEALLYEGVIDDDWELRNTTALGQELYLAFPR